MLTRPTKDTVLTYTNDYKLRDIKDRVLKIYCDTNRVCDVEDKVVEWYDSKYFIRQNEVMDLTFLRPLFHINSHLCGGIDGLISKIHLIAVQEGKCSNHKSIIRLISNPLSFFY